MVLGAARPDASFNASTPGHHRDLILGDADAPRPHQQRRAVSVTFQSVLEPRPSQ